MQDDRRLSRPPSGSRGELARHSSYGLTWVLTVALLGWGGLALDERLGTSPLLVLLGATLGIVGGFYRLYLRLIVEPERMKKGRSGGEEEQR